MKSIEHKNTSLGGNAFYQKDAQIVLTRSVGSEIIETKTVEIKETGHGEVH